jgi:hypothetical protein
MTTVFTEDGFVVPTKTCKKCLEVKLIYDFQPAQFKKKSSTCTECMRKAGKAYRRKTNGI